MKHKFHNKVQNGWEVIITSPTNLEANFPIIGWVENRQGKWQVEKWDLDGIHPKNPSYNLIKIKPGDLLIDERRGKTFFVYDEGLNTLRLMDKKGKTYDMDYISEDYGILYSA